MTKSHLTHDHYEILSLPFSGTTTSLSKQQLKIAYHKALLKHHPDKASSVAKDTSTGLPQPASQSHHHLDTKNNRSTNGVSVPTHPYTIDQITAAYKTLSDPHLRAEYDRELRLDRAKAAQREKTGTVFHTGLEVVDLEDLGCDEDGGAEDQAVWYRGCRCGDEKGFLVTEDELEREAEHGEIVIGCRGCSLWMKVLFAVDESDEQKT